MNKIGIIICNYNKKKFLKNCINSILSQTMKDFTIYVLDNASTDGSATMVRTSFANDVVLLEASENRGGSGGFNTGIREALQYDHEYIMLVDNDIIMDKNNIAALLECMDEHPEIGMVGSKILKMDFPDTIQDYGSMIDFDQLAARPLYANTKNNHTLPKIQYCDYVPACSLLVRREVINKIGLMPEDNFIYWDDMEWGWKCNLAGYKVAAYNAAVVWHKGGVNTSSNTFQTYYSYRNKSLFFAKYMPINKQKWFIERLLLEYYRGIYACYYSHKVNRAKTLMNALDDTLHGVKGKADEYKIRPTDTVPNQFEELLNNCENIYLLVSQVSEEILLKVLSRIHNYEKQQERQFQIILINASVEISSQKFSHCIFAEDLPNILSSCDRVFIVCTHIFAIKDSQYIYPFVDEYCNVIASQEDFLFCQNFQQNFALFYTCYEEILQRLIEKIHKQKGEKP